MTGTYIGTPHGGNDFTGESGSSVQNKMRQQAQNNIAAASQGGRVKVMSSDGQRVLFNPRTQVVTASGHVHNRPRGSGGGGGGVTRGPGAPAVRSGPQENAGRGPGLGVVTSGSAFEGPPLDPALKNQDNDVVTSVKLGVWVQPNPWMSDMSALEDAYGDDSPLLWPISAAKMGLDAYWTLDTYAGHPRAGINWNNVPKPAYNGPLPPGAIDLGANNKRWGW